MVSVHYGYAAPVEWSEMLARQHWDEKTKWIIIVGGCLSRSCCWKLCFVVALMTMRGTD